MIVGKAKLPIAISRSGRGINESLAILKGIFCQADRITGVIVEQIVDFVFQSVGTSAEVDECGDFPFSYLSANRRVYRWR